MAKTNIKDPVSVGRRLLCRYYGKEELFVAVVKEVSPSGSHALVSINGEEPRWGTHNLIEVVESLEKHS